MSTPKDPSESTEPTGRPADASPGWASPDGRVRAAHDPRATAPVEAVAPGPAEAVAPGPAPKPETYGASPAPATASADAPTSLPPGWGRRRGDGFALAALILGLSGLIVATIPFACFAAFPVVLAAAICGIVGGVRGTSRRTESFLGLGASALALVVAPLIAVSTFQAVPLLNQGFDDTGGWESLGEELDPQAEPYVVPDPVEERGSGDQTVAVEPVDGPGMYGYVLVTAQGTGSFRVTGLNEGGVEIEYLIDVVGPYDGAVLWNLNPSTDVTAFRIEADDAWSLSLRSTDEIPEVLDGGDRRGAGDAVYWYSGQSTRATLVGDDDSPVWMWSDTGPREGLCPAFESPTCSGTLTADYGAYLQVYAESGSSLTLGGTGDEASTT